MSKHHLTSRGENMGAGFFLKATQRKSVLLAAGFVVTAFIPQAAVHATDYIKADNTTALNLTTSYNPAGGPPTSTDKIVITSVMTAARSSALGANLSIDGISFDATSTKVFTITGSNTLTLGASGISLAASGVGAGLVLNGPAVVLGTSQTWDLGGKGITFNGGTTIDENGNNLTIATTGGQIFFHNTTAMTSNALITGGASLTLDQSGVSVTLTNAGSTFTAGAAISAGATLTSSTMNTGSGSSAVGSGAINLKGGTFQYSGSTATSAQNVTMDSRFVSTMEVTTAGQTLTLSNFKTTTNTNSVVGNGANVGGAGNVVISGVIADSTATPRTGIAITKFGTGTLTLSAVNTYTGATTVNAGTLLVNGTLNAGSAVAVNAGTLGGTGTVNGLVTTAGTTSIVSPGSGVGTLKLSGGLDATAGADFVFQLGTTSDLLNLGSGVMTGSTAASGLMFEFSDSGGLAANTTYTLMSFGSSTGLDYADLLANTLPSGFVLNNGFGTNGFLINGTNLQVQFSAVPEPSTYALLGAGLAALAILRRRSRKQA